MLELDPLPLKGDLLKTATTLKKIDIHLKPFTGNSPTDPEGMSNP
jgi:hypothetical protein